MNKRGCSTCLFKDVCDHKEVCKYHTPADDEMIDVELEKYIENTRREYRNDWWQYINEDAE